MDSKNKRAKGIILKVGTLKEDGTLGYGWSFNGMGRAIGIEYNVDESFYSGFSVSELKTIAAQAKTFPPENIAFIDGDGFFILRGEFKKPVYVPETIKVRTMTDEEEKIMRRYKKI